MPTLRVGEHSFECRPNLPAWQLMKLAKAIRTDDQMAQMAGMYDFIVKVVKPEEVERLDEAMNDADLEGLDNAIGELMKEYGTDRPTGRPSASPSGPTPTSGTSRVVSLSRATDKTDDTPPTAGQSAAS